MLNLLIAIIGSSNGKVKSMADISMYTEFADIIAENLFLIDGRLTLARQERYLVVTQHENLTLKTNDNNEVEDQIKVLT